MARFNPQMMSTFQGSPSSAGLPQSQIQQMVQAAKLAQARALEAQNHGQAQVPAEGASSAQSGAPAPAAKPVPRPTAVDSAIALERIFIPPPREKPDGPPTLVQHLTAEQEFQREISYSKKLRQHRDTHVAWLRRKKKDLELEREEKIKRHMGNNRFRYSKMHARDMSVRGGNVQLM